MGALVFPPQTQTANKENQKSRTFFPFFQGHAQGLESLGLAFVCQPNSNGNGESFRQDNRIDKITEKWGCIALMNVYMMHITSKREL